MFKKLSSSHPSNHIDRQDRALSLITGTTIPSPCAFNQLGFGLEGMAMFLFYLMLWI